MNIPRLDEPANVLGLMVIVNVQCKECLDAEILTLVGSQKAVCEGCGTVFVLDSVTWDRDVPVPQIRISSGLSRARSLVT